MTQAFEEDEKENADEAIELYTQAVELCIQAVSCHNKGKCFEFEDTLLFKSLIFI